MAKRIKSWSVWWQRHSSAERLLSLSSLARLVAQSWLWLNVNDAHAAVQRDLVSPDRYSQPFSQLAQNDE